MGLEKDVAGFLAASEQEIYRRSKSEIQARFTQPLS